MLFWKWRAKVFTFLLGSTSPLCIFPKHTSNPSQADLQHCVWADPRFPDGPGPRALSCYLRFQVFSPHILLLLFYYYSTNILLLFYHSTILLYILLAQAVCCPVAVLSNVWLLVIGYDEQLGGRNIPCASLILARHIVAHFFLISTIFIFIFRSLIILYADTGLER